MPGVEVIENGGFTKPEDLVYGNPAIAATVEK